MRNKKLLILGVALITAFSVGCASKDTKKEEPKDEVIVEEGQDEELDIGEVDVDDDKEVDESKDTKEEVDESKDTKEEVDESKDTKEEVDESKGTKEEVDEDSIVGWWYQENGTKMEFSKEGIMRKVPTKEGEEQVVLEEGSKYELIDNSQFKVDDKVFDYVIKDNKLTIDGEETYLRAE